MNRRKIIIVVVIPIVIVLIIIGFITGTMTGIVFPLLKKVVLSIPSKMWTRMIFKVLAFTGLMGSVTKWVNAQNERFLNGEVEYSLEKEYSLVVGYDFQTKPLIKRLLSESSSNKRKLMNNVIGKCVLFYRWLLALPPTNCILLITSCDVRTIRNELKTELTEEESKRVLYMRRDLSSARTYANLHIRGARAIYLMGDEGVSGRDSIVLQASEAIARKVEVDIKTESLAKSNGVGGGIKAPIESSTLPVKVFMQLEAPEFYSQMCSTHLPMDFEICSQDCGDTEKCESSNPKTHLFDLEVFNYYDSWVWKCWSERNSSDGTSPYLPIRFKSDAERVELFVLGSGRATKVIVDSAIKLMNYGEGERHCRMTLVSTRSLEILPSDDVIKSLPELEIVDYSPSNLRQDVFAKMLEAAKEEKCAVTIVVVEDELDKVIKTYLSLPFALRNQKISVLLWMGTMSRNIPEKSLLKVAGDNTDLHYFGMMDRLPWYGSNRQKSGVSVHYYYSECYGDKRIPKGTDIALIPTARSLWNEEKANRDWLMLERWSKWSSINSSDSFKEKMSIVDSQPMTLELQLKLLKAEHNRWWSERLLNDWRLGKRDNDNKLHPNLVPFEELDDFTKDVDKLCIAALAQQWLKPSS